MDRKPTKQEEKEFILGNKAADLWLTICDACANEKVIPKKYRYTTGTSLMNTVESICGDIEEANLIDLREAPRERLALQQRPIIKGGHILSRRAAKEDAASQDEHMALTLADPIPGEGPPDTSAEGGSVCYQRCPTRSSTSIPSKDVQA